MFDTINDLVEMFEITQDISEIGTWAIDLETHDAYWSNKVYDIFSVKKGTKINYDFFYSKVIPEDVEIIRNSFVKLIEEDVSLDSEFRIYSEEKIKWIHEKAIILKNFKGRRFVIGSAQDITRFKNLEIELKKGEEKFKNYLKLLPEIVFELDLNGKLLFANRKAYELFGYSEEEFARGLSALEMIIPEEREVAKERIKKRLAGDTFGAFEYNALRKDGTTFPILLNATPIMNGHEALSLLGVMTDISERKLNEKALAVATKTAEAANQAKDLFLAKASHEMRTPLTAIVGFCELLNGEEINPEYQRYVSVINQSANSLAALVEDILDLSKIESGQLSLRPKIFSVRELISNLVDSHKKQAEEKDVFINFNIDKDVPDLLLGDSQRIQQILINLLVNAIKFTSNGGIYITLTVAEVNRFRVLIDFEVQDTGVGISKDMIEHIFKPFVGGKASGNVDYDGSGLGLAISRSLADLMGGTLRVESKEGKGCKFNLLVPLLEKDSKKAEESFSAMEPINWQGTSLNILLAEDNTINSDFIKRVLSDMGHKVTVVENGRTALAAIGENLFDLVLMDVQMPAMSGTEALTVIREMEDMRKKRLKVIALTAYALIGDKEKYLKMGFDGYLSKPFRIKDLIDEMIRTVEIRY